MSAPSLQKRNIPLARQIRFVPRSLRRYAPCPHCIRSAHFNRVRLRVSPSAQDDALMVMRCEHAETVTPPADGYTSSVTCRTATCDSFPSRRSLQMRYSRLSNSHFSFTEESILKLVSLKVRNLVSLPLEGKETAAGCRMRCRMRSIRQEIAPISPSSGLHRLRCLTPSPLR